MLLPVLYSSLKDWENNYNVNATDIPWVGKCPHDVVVMNKDSLMRLGTCSDCGALRPC
jgi:hypothetical protein